MSGMARRRGEVVSRKGGLVVRGHDGAEHLLSPVAAAAWEAADGQRDAAALHSDVLPYEPSAGTERVFAILDELAGAGLLEERVAPPAAPSMNRRSLFRTLAAGAAAAAILTPVVARAAEGECTEALAFHKQEEAAKQEYKSEEQSKQVSYKKLKVGEEQAKKSTAIQEEHYKKKQTPASEQNYKGAVNVQEQNVKATAEQDNKSADYLKSGIKVESREKAAEQHNKGRFAFGAGEGLVFIDLPTGATLEGKVQLESVRTTSGDACGLFMDVAFDGLSSGGDMRTLSKVLTSVQKQPLSLQWGDEAQFAAQMTLTSASVVYTGFDAEGTPRLALARLAFA